MTTRVSSKMRPPTQHPPKPAHELPRLADAPVDEASDAKVASGAAKTNGSNGQARESERVIKLEFPVEFAGFTYETLTVRRLKARDFRIMDQASDDNQGGHAQAIAITALVCDVDEGVVDELDAGDYLRVQEAIADFFPPELVARMQAKASAS